MICIDKPQVILVIWQFLFQVSLHGQDAELPGVIQHTDIQKVSLNYPN